MLLLLSEKKAAMEFRCIVHRSSSTTTTTSIQVEVHVGVLLLRSICTTASLPRSGTAALMHLLRVLPPSRVRWRLRLSRLPLLRLRLTASSASSSTTEKAPDAAQNTAEREVARHAAPALNGRRRRRLRCR